MLNRRHLGGLGLLTTWAVASRRADAQSLPASMRGNDQSEYLFWLGTTERLEARLAAEALLNELDPAPRDRSRLAGVYGRAGSAHRKRFTEAAFIDRIEKFRVPQGPVRERAFQGVEGGFRFLPNFPDGEYVIVVFDTLFRPTQDIKTEQVTLGREPGRESEWLFVDYYVGQKPFYKY